MPWWGVVLIAVGAFWLGWSSGLRTLVWLIKHGEVGEWPRR